MVQGLTACRRTCFSLSWGFFSTLAGPFRAARAAGRVGEWGNAIKETEVIALDGGEALGFELQWAVISRSRKFSMPTPHRSFARPASMGPSRGQWAETACSEPALPVHPRTRGDNEARISGRRLDRGSPPYARGQYDGACLDSGRARFTPVRTGTIYAKSGGTRHVTVHPRTHGDNRLAIASGYGHADSPPYARGQCLRRPDHPVGQRFTPVRTGTMARGLVLGDRSAVHPRTHGDNLAVAPAAPFWHGSPPCARGQLRRIVSAESAIRFTPVRTGTMPVDDPRHQRGRFTPVRTGTIKYYTDYLGGIAVHPRTHGDNSSGSSGCCGACGSPPYARGQ